MTANETTDVPSGEPSGEPCGDLQIRVLAMPADTNPNGEIFGGWVLSHMDLAGLGLCRTEAKSRIVTAAINSVNFVSPVYVGDFLSCYTELIKVGNTSMQVKIQAWASGASQVWQSHLRLVTEGTFTYVAVDEKGKPIPVKRV